MRRAKTAKKGKGKAKANGAGTPTPATRGQGNPAETAIPAANRPLCSLLLTIIPTVNPTTPLRRTRSQPCPKSFTRL